MDKGGNSGLTKKTCRSVLYSTAYAYTDKTYRFMVNARTGEVQGEWPYSFWKIALTVLAAIAAVATTAILMNMSR